MSLADALAFPTGSLNSSLPVIDPALLGDSQDVAMASEGAEDEIEAKEEVEDEEMDLFGDAYAMIEDGLSLLMAK